MQNYPVTSTITHYWEALTEYNRLLKAQHPLELYFDDASL